MTCFFHISLLSKCTISDKVKSKPYLKWASSVLVPPSWLLLLLLLLSKDKNDKKSIELLASLPLPPLSLLPLLRLLLQIGSSLIHSDSWLMNSSQLENIASQSLEMYYILIFFLNQNIIIYLTSCFLVGIEEVTIFPVAMNTESNPAYPQAAEPRVNGLNMTQW